MPSINKTIGKCQSLLSYAGQLLNQDDRGAGAPMIDVMRHTLPFTCLSGEDSLTVIGDLRQVIIVRCTDGDGSLLLGQRDKRLVADDNIHLGVSLHET